MRDAGKKRLTRASETEIVYIVSGSLSCQRRCNIRAESRFALLSPASDSTVKQNNCVFVVAVGAAIGATTVAFDVVQAREGVFAAVLFLIFVWAQKQ